MKRASKWFRRVEIALWVLGISLVGVALEATLSRWIYQAQQERALFQRGPAVPRNPPQHYYEVTPTRPVQPGADGLPGTPVVAVDRSARPNHDDAAAIKRVAAVPQRIEETQGFADPAAVGRLEIPRLGVVAIVSEGDDEVTLDRAVGLIPGSAHPGEAGNMVLAGHRDTFFRPLREIRLNDRIRVVVPDHTYEYRVESMRVVSPDETSLLGSNGVEQLTLVTCYPFRFVGPAPERFVVSATRVN